ncbi:hypothetical protein CJU90_6209 [Yarrowia sp. C11]|nr:hypothetical protein CJU90_6209 [Yarrowia sp. C11]KAG5370917.1 hypothetical protein CKK34_1049 [Yarrowia sp. E02]
MIGFCDPAPEDSHSDSSSSSSATFAEFVQHLLLPPDIRLDDPSQLANLDFTEDELHRILMLNLERMEGQVAEATPYATRGIPWSTFKPRQEKNMTFASKVGRWLKSLPVPPRMLMSPQVYYPQPVERHYFQQEQYEQLFEVCSMDDSDDDSGGSDYDRDDDHDDDDDDMKGVDEEQDNPKYGDWNDVGMTPFPVSWIPPSALSSPHVQLCIDQLEPMENIGMCQITLTSSELLQLRNESAPGACVGSTYPLYPYATDYVEDEMYDLKSRIYTYNVLYHARLESMIGEPARSPAAEPRLRSDTEFRLRNMTLADVGQGVSVSAPGSLLIANYLPYVCRGLPRADEMWGRPPSASMHARGGVVSASELSDITNTAHQALKGHKVPLRPATSSSKLPCPIGSGSPFRTSRSRHHFRRPFAGSGSRRARTGFGEGEAPGPKKAKVDEGWEGWEQSARDHVRAGSAELLRGRLSAGVPFVFPH